MAINQKKVPENRLTHVAIIMDGNGRWAKERGFSRNQGHEAGVKNAYEITHLAQRFGIKYLTLYIFSTENWQRPKLEIKALFKLIETFLKKYQKELIENEIRVHIIGNYLEMPASIGSALRELVKKTENFTKFNLVLAVNYSSRMEIVEAVKKVLEVQINSKEKIEDFNWEKLSRYLYTKEIPDPDLIIRTSGETRLSNFLLLQGAYSEIYFSPVYWPDFKESNFQKAIESYYSRERRFGKISEQLNNTKNL